MTSSKENFLEIYFASGDKIMSESDESTYSLKKCCGEEKCLFVGPKGTTGRTFFKAVRTNNIARLLKCKNCVQNPNVLNSLEDSVLHVAAEMGSVRLLEILLGMPGINPNPLNAQLKTPLLVAVEHEHVDGVQTILKKGGNPNYVDSLQRTALHYAVQMKNLELVTLLCENGAEIHRKDAFGDTPVSLSMIDFKDIDILRYLLLRGANPFLENERGNAFFECILSSRTKKDILILKTILKKYPHGIYRRNVASGQNCLHMVAISGYVNVAEFLISEGADLNCRDTSKRIPYDLAVQLKNHEVAKTLKISAIIKKGLGMGSKEFPF